MKPLTPLIPRRTIDAMGHKFNDRDLQCICLVHWGEHQDDPQPCTAIRKERKPLNNREPAKACRRGHPYSEHGFYSGRNRRCRICVDLNTKRYCERKKEMRAKRDAEEKEWIIPHQQQRSDEVKRYSKKKKFWVGTSG